MLETKQSCDSLYCNAQFISVVWNQTYIRCNVPVYNCWRDVNRSRMQGKYRCGCLVRTPVNSRKKYWKEIESWGRPWWPVVKNPSADGEDAGPAPGPGRFRTPQATSPCHASPITEPVLCSRRSDHTKTRKLWAARKTQSSQNKKQKKFFSI